MEAELAGGVPEEGRMRVVVAFADLAGYTRITEERGDEEAVGVVERFVEAVQYSLPIDARVIKTLGDEVMVVGADAVALTQWAVRFQLETPPNAPAPRIGIHYGEALYRDGDYYGRDVNQAARVVARAAGGEVLLTRRVVDVASGIDGLRFELIGEIGLKGFSEPIELFHALASGE
jgi:adenylate cyclase